MQKAISEKSPIDARHADRFGDLVLVRIACALRGATKAEVAADLLPFAGASSPAQWRARVDVEIETWRPRACYRDRRRAGRRARPARLAPPNIWASKAMLPHVWSELRDVRLVAVALGLKAAAANRTKALATLDGLRGAIVESAFKLGIKGVPTPARLRDRLAAAALRRAFGDKSTADLAGKLDLSAQVPAGCWQPSSRRSRATSAPTRV